MITKHPRLALFSLTLPLLGSHSTQLQAQTDESVQQQIALSSSQMATIIVTGSPLTQPNRISLDPKSPVQPIPTADGAGLLKTVPNMSITRKGGMAGDPLFRGLGGSRLSITSDNNYVLGGCGGRMDPPTAYLFPRSYDEVVITKGPQTVTQGPGLVAGSIQFLRNPSYYAEPEFNLETGLTTGSQDRLDGFVALDAGNQFGYLRLNGNQNQAHDYKDGAGYKVHSAYDKNSQSLQLGLTPDELSLLEVSLDRSRGEAAYADRSMDGSQFDRDAWSVKAERYAITHWLSTLQLQYGHSLIDHVMDNYNLRDHNSGMFSAMNPKRSTDTARAMAELSLGEHITKVGVDWLADNHSSRMAMGMSANAANSYQTKAYQDTQSFRNVGFFIEDNWQLNPEQRLISGLRLDHTQARFEKMPASNTLKEQDYQLQAGFLRFEHSQQAWTWYGGYGQAERAPDFWERNRNSQLNSETNYQIDTGVLYKAGKLSGSASLFASYIDDFILVDNLDPARARNINARRAGGELEVAWQFVPDWSLSSNLAYTYGQNHSDGVGLGQTPPLELNTSLVYDNGIQEAALLIRNVAKQSRFAEGQGNIIGQDLGAASGFTVFSVNGGWQLTPALKLTAGVDNIFDKQYSEFINKQDADIAGINPQIARINEPGRQWWADVQLTF
ncbi:TonB-dependent copper receptor [Oceanisphaera avium]|uniref:TonB-dependent copper receptor n=1 Tax=Oceanisphaera avium TaxID=1903694 RepID=A0A1Y0D071_9GAMM|nr:TonB-dependent copper receptor [Oceanisphaera avium]ART80982.1 TonB-dependent copper receptor [Oceanisphaera avium]